MTAQTPEQLDDLIVALAERGGIEEPSSPVVTEVRACLDAGDQHGAVSILGFGLGWERQRLIHILRKPSGEEPLTVTEPALVT